MVIERLFRVRPARAAGRGLYARVVEQSRSPFLYRDLAAPDTVEGRFELYTLHLVLVLERLQGHGARAAETGQALFDAYLKGLDDALREMGVGDLSVGRKMRRLGEAFYGRVKSYLAAIEDLPDQGPLEDLVRRTVYEDGEAGRAADLVAYLLAERAALAAQPLERVLDGEVRWARR